VEMIEASHPFADLWAKVQAGERLTKEDGIRLMRSNDLLALGYMANHVKEKKHEKRVYFFMEKEDPAGVAVMDPDFFSLNHEEQVERLLHVRDMQEKQGSFRTFRIMRGQNDLFSTGYNDLRVIAVSRLLLDNVEHIQTSFAFADEKLVQMTLFFGVDDLLATKENDSGTDGPVQTMESKEIIRMIEKAGLQPVPRDASYHIIGWEPQVK
jgi:aminodeoxyfutalosine synthase